VTLVDKETIRWCPPSRLSIAVSSPPKIASGEHVLTRDKRYELRLLSPLSRRRLLGYLQAWGFDPDRMPIKTRTSVRVSSNFPALSEYLVTGAWTKEGTAMSPLTPGFILEESAESKEAPRG
jgi:hypothetical protein